MRSARYTRSRWICKNFDWISSEADSLGILLDGHRGRTVRRFCGPSAGVAVYHLGNNVEIAILIVAVLGVLVGLAGLLQGSSHSARRRGSLSILLV